MAEKSVLFERGGVMDGDSEDVWDDTALIHMWDKSIEAVKKDIFCDSIKDDNKQDDLVNCDGTSMNDSSEISVASNDGISNSKVKEYHIGQHVRAPYSFNNQEYEAVITRVMPWTNTCVIKFLGYGNNEEVSMTDLKKSQGKDAIQNQIVEARWNFQEEDDTAFGHFEDEEPQFQEPIEETSNVNCGFPLKPNEQEETDHSHYHRPQIPPTAQSHQPHVVPSMIPPTLTHRTHSEQEAFTSMLMSWYLNGYHTGYYEGLKHGREASKTSMNKHRNPNSYYTKK